MHLVDPSNPKVLPINDGLHLRFFASALDAAKISANVNSWNSYALTNGIDGKHNRRLGVGFIIIWLNATPRFYGTHLYRISMNP
jgi:hypothetical protein